MTPPARTPPLLERLGLRYLAGRAGRRREGSGGGPVHLLDASERAALRSVQRGAVVRAALAGAVSTAVSAAAEVLARPLLGSDPEAATFRQSLPFWGVVIGATVVASVLEILFLYWDSLRSVHELAHRAGLRLFADDERHAVAAALARAALELPNPNEQVFGVDPRREASRARLVVASLIYKAKISVSNFVAKVVVRRIAGRAAMRTLLPFVAVPVTAVWNALVAWMVLREARLRAMGPSAARELVALALSDGPELTPAGRLAAVRAVAAAIVRTQDLHPNLHALLLEVLDRVGPPKGEVTDDPQLLLEQLPALSEAERRVALRLLGIGAVIDGRLSVRERRLVAQAQELAGLARDDAALFRLRRALRSGAQLRVEDVRALA